MTHPIPSPELRGFAPLLQVFDMPAAVRFYRDMLGFEVSQRSGEGDDVDWMLLENGPIQLMLNTAYEKEFRPESPDPLRIRSHADLTLYFGCPEIDNAYAHLQLNGISVDPPATTGYGWYAIDFNDPDGYHICFHWPKTNAEDA